jgi:hypothetical protein
MIVDSADSWLKLKLRDVKTMVKEWYDGAILWKDYPIYLVNTKEGRLAYYRATGESPDLKYTRDWHSEYGNKESYEGKHFIFLNPILVGNFVRGDVLSTLVHEILHVIHANAPEEEIKDMEKMVCEQFNIIPDNILEEL